MQCHCTSCKADIILVCYHLSIITLIYQPAKILLNLLIDVSSLFCSIINFPAWHNITDLTFFMQDLCAICTDFIISDLWTSNFLTYQVPNCCSIFFYFIIHVFMYFSDNIVLEFRCSPKAKIMVYMVNELEMLVGDTYVKVVL